MAHPKEAGEQADRLIAELNQARGTVAEVVQGTENQNAAAGTIPDPAGEIAVKPDVSVSAEPVVAAVSPDLSSVQNELAAANQRWMVLQGMIAKKDGELDQLRNLLAKLNTSKPDEQKEATPVAQGGKATREEIEEFGQDLIDLIVRLANEVVQSPIAQINAKIDGLQQSVKGVGDLTAQTSVSIFEDALTKRVPNWRAINLDPTFEISLQEVDEYSGIRKIDLLNDAYNSQDLNRTALFFERFKGTPAPVLTTDKPAPKVDPLVKMISPGHSKGAPVPIVPVEESRIWTKADISKLYSDKRTGAISAEEFDRLEQDVYKAQRDGRIAA